MCPQTLPSASSRPLPPAPSLGTKFTQCKYAEPHARTHENTRTHTHAHSRRTNAHRHSHWQLSFPFYLSLPLPLCCILYNDAFFPLLLQLQNSYQRHFPFGQAWASCGLGVAGWRAGTACTQKLFKNSLQVLHKMMEKREDDKINPAHTLTHSDPHTLEQKPPKIWNSAPSVECVLKGAHGWAGHVCECGTVLSFIAIAVRSFHVIFKYFFNTQKKARCSQNHAKDILVVDTL